VKDLITSENWCVFGFESSHGFLSVSDFSVHAFHFVIVMVTSYGNMANMLCSCFLFP
jgi:hypothetical protein